MILFLDIDPLVQLFLTYKLSSNSPTLGPPLLTKNKLIFRAPRLFAGSECAHTRKTFVKGKLLMVVVVVRWL